jgi:hypothetical protein
MILQHIEQYASIYLAGVAGTVTALTGAGVIPDQHLKYYVAFGAVLGVWKGVLEQIRYAERNRVSS